MINTQFLNVQDIADIINKIGIENVLQGIADYITSDYLRWQEFQKCPRVANHSVDGVIELMPISDATSYAFKYVNGHPKNSQNGLPTVMAFGILADVNTGVPMLLSELTLTTALRTAAMSVVAARVLARDDCKSMALIGNGAQSEFQALAFYYLLGINELRLYDIDPSATDKLMKNLSHTGLHLTRCKSIKEAVKGADIITTITADKTNATIITLDMIEQGVHINGVGGDCPGKTELHADVLRAASVFVEYEPQTRIEGDLQQLPASFAVTELWKVLSGESHGRTTDSEVTVFDSVGFALEDYSALRYMRDVSNKLRKKRKISLVPTLADPKDLFGII
jgi:ornithine cyclodeaminase